MTGPDLFGRYAWGIAHVDGNPVYYELIDEWVPEQRPGPAGGVLTLQIRTGRQVWQARTLWAKDLLEVTPAVMAAIEADRGHHASKVGE